MEKSESLEEALSYPITSIPLPVTSIPLSLAYPGGHLRQGNKSNLRNQIITDSPLPLSELAPTGTWIYDGKALYKRLKLTKVLREAMLLPAEYNATEVPIVNDLCWKMSTKNDTRLPLFPLVPLSLLYHYRDWYNYVNVCNSSFFSMSVCQIHRKFLHQSITNLHLIF